MTREDAEKCLEHDIQGILVSNHGGRQLDGVPATVRKSRHFISDHPKFNFCISKMLFQILLETG